MAVLSKKKRHIEMAIPIKLALVLRYSVTTLDVGIWKRFLSTFDRAENGNRGCDGSMCRAVSCAYSVEQEAKRRKNRGK